ncbi:hypothetical protein F5B22DRAFT_636908 [Xylaria bambusicola]|uniref:uncharacterized protein n=1 Tax=Xylaria bambusicola TaxID=326684 RepID=UPI00200819EB|nr:uncharacterized protein F5B22DRAFT_636908 [Xylaria bambusicola]KAI0514833.1 hypothetical protein F5B22DRAFT_636908 [Xylaria bambusicola]
MGRQEASPPPQRQRVPHHRHHRHRRNHRSPLQATNYSQPLDLGRFSRHTHAPSSRVIVESWLGQLTAPAPVPAKRLASPETRNHLVHQSKHLRSQDRDQSPRCHRRRRVDQLWRPHYIPAVQGASPLRLLVLGESPEKSKQQKKRKSGNSSLISSLSSRQEILEWDSTENTSKHGGNTGFKRLDETEVGTVTASSLMSHASLEVPIFEKRPRRKTRPEKYDARKPESQKRKNKGAAQREHERRGTGPRKGRHLAAGRNVMKDFTSGAVLSNRITVHPNLKPGLFNNKRMPKEHPIADLSFSEMPFPRHPERDVSRHKGLSNSQVRERRRESRELEQISSFFLPASAESMPRKSKSAKLKDTEVSRNEQPPLRDSLTSLSSPTAQTRSYRQESALPIEDSDSIPDTKSHDPDCRTTPSKTTYFTWSTSQQSPQARGCVGNTGSRKSGRSVTPNDIREALATTGVYRKTKTSLLGDLDGTRKHALLKVSEASSARNNMAVYRDAYEGHTLDVDHEAAMEPRWADDTGVEMAQLTGLEKRWNKILPPEWKSRRLLKGQTSPVNEQQPDVVSDTLTREYPSGCHELPQGACAKTMRDLPSGHSVHHDGNTGSRVDTQRIGRNTRPVSLETNQPVEDDTAIDEDQVTTVSRNAMPPPPIPPPRSNSLHTTGSSPAHNISSSIGAERNKPPDALSQEPSAPLELYMVASEHGNLDGQSERLFQPMDSASWLPQSVPSGVNINDRNQTLSRLSMRSPIYVNQGKQIESEETLRIPSPAATSKGETMADFIARIESEVGEPTSADEPYQSKSVAKNPRFSVDQTGPACDTHNQYLTVSDRSLRNYHCLPIGTIDEPMFQHVWETSNTLCSAAGMREEFVRGSMGGQGDDGPAEFLEMSEFWRPNRFSQF